LAVLTFSRRSRLSLDVLAIDRQHMALIARQYLVGTGAGTTAQGHVVDAGVAVDDLAHLAQLQQQFLLVPGSAAGRSGAVVVVLLGMMHHVGQVQQAVGTAIALDGVHVAEQLGDGKGRGLRSSGGRSARSRPGSGGRWR
jgi:hypothetical protein